MKSTGQKNAEALENEEKKIAKGKEVC